jgi:hypothetical protein
LIVLRMQGGLGNQLFQLAAGLYAEEQLSTSVLYDTSWYKHCQAATKRAFEVAPLLSHQRLVTLLALLWRVTHTAFATPFIALSPNRNRTKLQEQFSSC